MNKTKAKRRPRASWKPNSSDTIAEAIHALQHQHVDTIGDMLNFIDSLLAYVVASTLSFEPHWRDKAMIDILSKIGKMYLDTDQAHPAPRRRKKANSK